MALILMSPHAAFARDMWYSEEEQDRINIQLSQMQEQIGQLQHLNAQLEAKVQAQPVVAAQVAQADPRVEQLERRVSSLETAVAYIQKNVLSAITTVIGLLQKLLIK